MEAELNHLRERRDRLLVDREAVQARANAAKAGMNAIDERRVALQQHVEAVETGTGCLPFGVRLFPGARVYEVIARIYQGIQRLLPMDSGSPLTLQGGGGDHQETIKGSEHRRKIYG